MPLPTTTVKPAGRASAGRWLALAADRRGTAAMEFALCGTAFVALLVAAAQVALVYFAQQCIQTSTEAMARKIMTGEIRQSTMTAEQFRLASCATLPAYMDCTRLLVDAREATTFAGVATGMPTISYDATGRATGGLSYTTGTAGSIVILRLFYRWSVTSMPVGLDLSNQPGGGRLLVGTMVFKSEPYAT